MTALILSGLVLFFALAVYRREWGVYLTVLLLPDYQIRFSVGFLPLTFLESAVLLLGLVQIIDLTRRRAWREALKSLTRSPAPPPFSRPFLLSALLSLFTLSQRARAAFRPLLSIFGLCPQKSPCLGSVAARRDCYVSIVLTSGMVGFIGRGCDRRAIHGASQQNSARLR